MIRHANAGKTKEPKLQQVKERVPPFEGNYASVYQDYVDHKIGTTKPINTRDCCIVTPQEKEEMVLMSAKRILEQPEMAKQVFNLQTV